MINIIQGIVLCLLLIMAFPLGFLLAHLTQEELQASRKAFKALCIAAVLIAILGAFFLDAPETKALAVFSMLFIFILTAISLKQSERVRLKKPMKRKGEKKRKKGKRK